MKACKTCCFPDKSIFRADGAVIPSITIELDENGICNVCRRNDVIRDAIVPENLNPSFLKKIDSIRSTEEYDAAIGISAGKDSTYVAYSMVKNYDLNILAWTYQSFTRPEAEDICLDFIKKLQNKFPGKVTFVPLFGGGFSRNENEILASRMREVFRIGFLEHGLPCVGCTIWIANYFTQIPLAFHAPLSLSGADPYQMRAYMCDEWKSVWQCITPRYMNRSWSSFIDESRKLMGDLLCMYFGSEEVRRKYMPEILPTNLSPEWKSLYYNTVMKSNINEPGNKDKALRVLEKDPMNIEKLYPMQYFFYHDYDEKEIRKILNEELGYIAPSTHYDCIFHDVVDYLFAEIYPLNMKACEHASMVREGLISKEEAEHIIHGKEKIPYPDKEALEKFCYELMINEADFDKIIKYHKNK